MWFSGKGAFIRQGAFNGEERLIQTCQLRWGGGGGGVNKIGGVH